MSYVKWQFLPFDLTLPKENWDPQQLDFYVTLCLGKKGRIYHMKYMPLHRQWKSTSALQGLLLLLLADANRLNFYQEGTQRSFVPFQTQTP